MLVKHEIKSQLAKLLATEDLIVEHRKTDTAQFNVHTRVLTLPNWERASNNIYDSLVAHEVGHALYTPDEWDWMGKIPQTFVNIVEDARIEKLMKRKFAGLAKTFYNGYNELNDKDFFEIDGQDINDLNLADRTNLFFKIGSFIDVSFSTPEKEIVTLIKNAETFTDTLAAAEALYNFCKQELEKKQKEQENNPECEQDAPTGIEGSGNFSTDDGDDCELTVPDSSSNDTLENGTGGTDNVPVSHGSDSVEPEVYTAEALEERLQELNSLQGAENVYFELPKLKLENYIIPNSQLHEEMRVSFTEAEDDYIKRDRVNIFNAGLFEHSDDEFIKFKKNAQKEVNYLVKEFECKKAADSYARTTTHRTGVLDTRKLHTYKFNEDLFKKVGIVPDGKNHGLVFILDWSGSMQGVIKDTLKQLYNLMWFCKKVNIPFEVYAFTNCYPVYSEKPRYERKSGVVAIEDHFSLMNLFTSKVRSNILEEQMKYVFRLAHAFCRDSYTAYNIPIGMNLSGTPLNEALITLHSILPQFKRENKLQKVQCVVLTDGEAAPISYAREIQRHWEDTPYLGSAHVNDRCILRNRKTGYTYSCQGLGYWAQVTDLLLKDLRQTFPDINFIGIRVLASRDAGQFVRTYTGYEGDEYETIMKRWKKEKSFAIKNSGYHTYFGLSSTALANDDEFDVKEDASKAEIKRAFVKSLKTKKMNKKILGEFIELVA